MEQQISTEKDPEKKSWLEFMRDFAAGKKSKNEKMLREMQELDKHLRNALSLVLNYYAQNGQFNQKLLEDVAQLTIQRSKKAKHLK